MSWEAHYQRQAEAHRKEAHAWVTHGKEHRAKFHLDAAEIYEQLAEKARKSEQVRRQSR